MERMNVTDQELTGQMGLCLCDFNMKHTEPVNFGPWATSEHLWLTVTH